MRFVLSGSATNAFATRVAFSNEKPAADRRRLAQAAEAASTGVLEAAEDVAISLDEALDLDS